MATDSGDFYNAPEPGLLPLYEAKLIHQFDHRWASYDDVRQDGTLATRNLLDEQRMNPRRFVYPRYWVRQSDVEARLAELWDRDWLLSWRGIARNTDERTVIASAIPRVGVGGNHYLLMPVCTVEEVALLLANFNSVVFDHAARQKVGGSHIHWSITKQLPVLTPNTYDQSTVWQPDTILRDWIADRVLELSYTAWDLQPFAQDLGYDGPPFKWDPERRFEIRCELDAAYFHLYEIERDDVDYIMSTFPIVQRKDIAAHGTYRTRDRILEIYDAMASGEWQSSLNPPVADPRAAHDVD